MQCCVRVEKKHVYMKKQKETSFVSADECHSQEWKKKYNFPVVTLGFYDTTRHFWVIISGTFGALQFTLALVHCFKMISLLQPVKMEKQISLILDCKPCIQRLCVY